MNKKKLTREKDNLIINIRRVIPNASESCSGENELKNLLQELAGLKSGPGRTTPFDRTVFRLLRYLENEKTDEGVDAGFYDSNDALRDMRRLNRELLLMKCKQADSRRPSGTSIKKGTLIAGVALIILIIATMTYIILPSIIGGESAEQHQLSTDLTDQVSFELLDISYGKGNSYTISFNMTNNSDEDFQIFQIEGFKLIDKSKEPEEVLFDFKSNMCSLTDPLKKNTSNKVTTDIKTFGRLEDITICDSLSEKLPDVSQCEFVFEKIYKMVN